VLAGHLGDLGRSWDLSASLKALQLGTESYLPSTVAAQPGIRNLMVVDASTGLRIANSIFPSHGQLGFCSISIKLPPGGIDKVAEEYIWTSTTADFSFSSVQNVHRYPPMYPSSLVTFGGQHAQVNHSARFDKSESLDASWFT
jgi:hypothetical protein